MTSKTPSDAKKALEFSATSEPRLECSRICKNPDLSNFVRILANSATKQFSQVCFNAFREHRRIVATFQDANDAPICMNVRNLADDLRQLNEIFHFEAERANRVCSVRVEPRADKNKLWANSCREFVQSGSERFT